MEYAGAIWDPTYKNDRDRLARIQNQAARWACREYGVASVSQLRKRLGWSDLSDRRMNQRLVIFYKVLVEGSLKIDPGEIGLA